MTNANLVDIGLDLLAKVTGGEAPCPGEGWEPLSRDVSAYDASRAYLTKQDGEKAQRGTYQPGEICFEGPNGNGWWRPLTPLKQ
jgi:hypothetical protein